MKATAPGGQIRPVSDARRGAALLTVLLFAALLTGLAAAATQSATSGARAAAVFLDAMRADDLGRAAADAVASFAATGGPATRRGGAFAINLAQADLEVNYLSESARVDVNMAPISLIAAVLAAAGAEPSLVAAAVNRIAAERPEPQSSDQAGPSPFGSPFGIAPLGGPQSPAGAGAVQAAVVPSSPSPRQQFQTTEAALRAWGLPDDLARRVLPALTVANRTPKVDPILADRMVLMALLGADERVDDYIERRRTGFADADAALALIPVGSKPFATFSDVSAVRARARVTIAHRFVRRYELVVQPSEFAGTAPKLLFWQPLF